MLSKNCYRIFYANRYIFLCLLLSLILILPFKSNAQWMPNLGGYGVISNPIQGLLGYNPFGNPLQYTGGYGFGVNPMQDLLGYGILGSQIQYTGGYGFGMNPVREPITEKGLISKIKGLGGGKTAQISKSDDLVGYYECIVISNDMVPLPIFYNDDPCLVDTNDVIGIVKSLFDNNDKFVFVRKAEGMSNKFLVFSNVTPYSSTSFNIPVYGGWMTYPPSVFSRGLSLLDGSGSTVSPYLSPFAYTGIGGLLGDMTGYSAMQYLGQRINEANLLPYLYPMFTEPIYGNPLIPLILGNIPLYGRPTIIPSETSGNDQTLSGGPLRNGYFNLLNPGLSNSMNLLKTPFQTFIPPFF